MWEFPGGSDDPRFLVIARLPDFTAPASERLIVHGGLLTPDDARPVGVVLALQAETREAVDALLRRGRSGVDVEILDWEFGGRR